MIKFLMINHRVGGTTGWDEFVQMLKDGGHLIGGSEVGEGDALKGGVISKAVSESIAGYMILQAADLEAARAIARQCPVHQAGGTVELFPLVCS